MSRLKLKPAKESDLSEEDNMLYALIFSILLFYASMAHITYRFTVRIRRAWFGDYIQDTPDALLSLGWPVTLPAFYASYYHEIRAVKRGIDWADIHVPTDKREEYKKLYMKDI